MGNNQGLVIERVFDAPRELVWKAWSDPEMMMAWWGPKNFTSPTIKIDFKVGGKYLLCMHGAPGPGMPEQDFWSTGVYQEIVPLEKIVIKDSFADAEGNVVPASYYGMPGSFPLEAIISVTFEDAGQGQTKMTLSYPSIAGIEGQMLDSMTQGWNQSFDKLTENLKE